MASLIKTDGQIAALIKPQFEAGRRNVGKGGVVRDPDIHRQVIQKLCDLALRTELAVLGLTYSPVRGPAGNIEYLVWLQKGNGDKTKCSPEIIDKVVFDSHMADNTSKY